MLELVAELKGHLDRVWNLAWHPSGRLLASCSGDKTVRLWAQDATGTWVATNVLDGMHKRTVRSVCWSPDGEHLASASFDATTGIWEKGMDREYECVATLEGHENEVKSVGYSAGGNLLATCSRDKSVWIWEVEDDTDFSCLSVLQEHTQDVKMVCWHPNEELLASASYDDTIRIWRENRNNDDWMCSDTLEGHTSTVWAVDFNADGNHLASVSDDLSLRIWKRYGPGNARGIPTPRNEPRWRTVMAKPDAHDRTIFGVSWSKVHGRIATCGSDNRIRVWEQDDIASSDPDNLVWSVVATVDNAHGQSDINCVAWNPVDSNSTLLASAGDDQMIRIWRLAGQPNGHV
ncbi:WD40-repeat-containing domain protein [Hyaloraphidium curvatum]|nr:WD40-repeat-containing domain protein [Hyaloraphidium curvatum]